MSNIEYLEQYFNLCDTCGTRNLGCEMSIARAVLGSCILLYEYPGGVPADTPVQSIRKESGLDKLSDVEIQAAVLCANSRLSGDCAAGHKVWKSSNDIEE